MRAYAVIAGGEPIADAAVAEMAQRALPFGSDGRPEATHVSRDGRVRVLAWHNEPDQPDRPLLAVLRPDAVRGLAGQADPAWIAPGWDPATASGVWTVLEAIDGEVRARTCASGAETLFIAEHAERTVIGTRALLVALLARDGRLELDPVGLAAVANAGYATTDRTVLAGVRAVRPDSLLVWRDGRVRVDPAMAEDAPQDAEAVADALVRSVALDADAPGPIRMGLTGGRDSRLMVALLHRAGMDVTTRTAGAPDDPDVVVAREVAALLGVPHIRSRPTGAKRDGNDLVVDVGARLHQAVVLGEGMLGAYDAVGRIDAPYDADLVAFGGTGGEILRGYYAADVADVGLAEVRRRYVRKRIVGHGRRLAPDVRRAYEADIAPWLADVDARGGAALEDLYVRQRTARWAGAARSATSLGSLARRPFLDHLVVRRARAVDLDARVGEHLVHDVLRALAPTVADHRFAGKRWAFDRLPPTDPAARAAWTAREPLIGADGARASFDWRITPPQVRDDLAARLLDAPPPVWDVLDRRAVESFLAKPWPRPRAELVHLWNLATVAETVTTDVGLQGRFDRPATPLRITPANAQPVEPTPPSTVERMRTSSRAAALSVARRIARSRRR